MGEEIQSRLLQMRDESQARHLARFFKTGEGQYGYGDKFLGIRVPTTRSIVKEYRHSVCIEDCACLIRSEWHEIRLAGFLLLIEIYRHAKRLNNSSEAKKTVDFYVENIKYGNNWDLVDLVSQYILGDRLVSNPDEREILYELADMEGHLWHQRVAVVSTLALIRAGEFDDTVRIAKKFLTHTHDLIHKATGWMLREMGKRGGYDRLIEFLDEFATVMPRTALRYSIERLPENLRKHYLSSGH